MKTAEELNALKEEVETLSAKLRELTEEELKQVTGGAKKKKKRPLPDTVGTVPIHHSSLEYFDY